jgi:glycosyltransferase involved in cell wall biosynthesis
VTAVGVACSADPRDVTKFSGIPAALMRGLTELGHEVAPIPATLAPGRQRRVQYGLALVHALGSPGRLARAGSRSAIREVLRESQSRLVADPVLARLRTAAAGRAVAHAGTLDGCVQFGTDFRLPHALPYVTYDDQTVVQAARAYDYSWTRVLSDRALRRLIDQQRAVLSSARACCTTSHWAAESIVEDYGVPRERVLVAGIGADPVGGEEQERSWASPRFLFVGKDWERKNGAGVLAAFAAVRREQPQATLDLVGGHPPVQQPGVTGHGLLDPADPASQSRLRGLYRRATCFVMPSRHEPSAIAYVEAASAGIGSIATASGGSATLVGGGGIMVDPRDREAVTSAMLRFCDAAVAQRLGALARERAKELTWQRVAARLVVALTGRGDAAFL